MSAWSRGGRSALLIAALLGSSCSSVTETAGGDSAAATGVSFCSSWAGMQKFVDSDELIDEVGLTEYLELRGSASESAPDELADAWDAIVAWDDQFVELLYAVNFQGEDITEQMVAGAFGSLDAAEAASVDQERAFEAVDRWSVGNCGDGGVDTLTFCAIWADIYVDLSGVSRYAENEEGRQRTLVDLIVEASVAVVPEIGDSWDAFASYHLALHDIMITVNFDESLVSDEFLTDAFGSPVAAAAEERDAADAADVIEEWSVTGCGDFCIRGGEAMGVLANYGEGQFNFQDQEGLYQQAHQQRLLDAVGQIVPPALEASWGLAIAEVFDWIVLFESLGYDHQRLGEPEQALEIYRNAEYFIFGFDPNRWPEGESGVRDAVEAWRNGADLPQDLLDEIVWVISTPPAQRPGWGDFDREIDEWIDINCADVARAGVLEVEFSEITGSAGDFLVLAAGPVGSTFTEFADMNAFVAGTCSPIDRDPWGVEGRDEGRAIERLRWPMVLRGEVSNAEDLCSFGGQPGELDPGAYTLVVAQYEALIYNAEEAGEPTHCLAIDFTISGDTLIQLPELAPCDVDRTVIGPDDWRFVEPVSASMPGAGTLKVRIVDHLVPPSLDSQHGGAELSVLVLPEGTTLNEVGREQVFPSGVGCVRLGTEGELRPGIEPRLIEIPIGKLPPIGLHGCLDPLWLNGLQPLGGDSRPEAPADDSKLPLTVLAPGIYDVRASALNPDGDRMLCASFEVRIDGDTIVDLPELEECV